ncbi:hypothetical protein RJ641_032152 [Dillenia turbinata]|uniref:Uncharacterized protein n=1 Tax=Dillenia turbinata TaxID=194707 RepID=A0AAN8VVQ9_9MAGN
MWRLQSSLKVFLSCSVSDTRTTATCSSASASFSHLRCKGGGGRLRNPASPTTDIEPIICFTKEILHSDSLNAVDKYIRRYMDGEHLSAEDEKAVINRLLAYHLHAEDKIGCGLNSIMTGAMVVDRHPQFRNSRCLFVIKTDGGWIDFSYQKCISAYIRDEYPSYAEGFIRKHYKRQKSKRQSCRPQPINDGGFEITIPVEDSCVP